MENQQQPKTLNIAGQGKVATGNMQEAAATQQQKVKSELEKLGNKVQISEAPTAGDEQKEYKDETEVQLAKLQIEKYDVMAHIYINNPAYVILELNHTQDYKSEALHYVPRVINEEYRNQYGNKKYCIELYAIANKNVQRSLKKLIRRQMPGTSVELIKIHETE